MTITSVERKTAGHGGDQRLGLLLKERLLPGRYEVKAELAGFRSPSCRASA